MARFSTQTIVTAVLLFANSTFAHMIMNTPAGFPGIIDEVNPLSPPQYQFPCQAGTSGNYGYTSATTATAGSTILVNFTGSAVHGGGVCQFSVANYPPPADPKQWKVVYTIHGGCPASALLNLATVGEDAEGRADGPHCTSTGGANLNCVKSYNVPIPAGLKNGNYVFSWTWLNALGNREIYQSCAPISVQGSNNSLDISSLPSIFFANYYPSTPDCSTAEGVLLLPQNNYNASLSEWSPYLPDEPQASAIGNCSSYYGTPTTVFVPSNYISLSEASATGSLASMTSSWVSAGTAPASAAGNLSVTAGTPSVSYSSTSTVTLQSTVYATGTPPSSGSAPTSVPSSASSQGASPTSVFSSASVQGSAPPAAATNATPSGIAPPANCTVPCNGQPDGTVLCVGATQFGICNFGCAVAQMLAAGTTCSNGAITKRMVDDA